MMKKKIVFLLALSVLLSMMITAGSTLAYFTSYAHAKGSQVVHLGDGGTYILVDPSQGMTRRVYVGSEPDSLPVFVRVKAFCGSNYELKFADDSGELKLEYETNEYHVWTLNEDGFIYYDEILYGGDETPVLSVMITDNLTEEQKKKLYHDGYSFNLAVIYETTPVLYNADGEPYSDWSISLDQTYGEGGMD